MPADKRARRPTLTPSQFNTLIEFMPEPYATMVYVAIWTGLRVSELIASKWRCDHADSITVDERFCRGDVVRAEDAGECRQAQTASGDGSRESQECGPTEAVTSIATRIESVEHK
jgi:hypothetical protein